MRGTLIFLLAAASALQGCQVVPNVITGIYVGDYSLRPNSVCDRGDRGPTPPGCTPEVHESLRFAPIGSEIQVFPLGTGTCAAASIDFGDGTPIVSSQNQLLADMSWKVPHTYTGWPGKKTIRVKGLAGCIGEVARDYAVGIGADGHEDFRLGFAVGIRPGAQCQAVPTGGGGPMPPIRRGSGVRIEADGGRIDYGVLLAFDAGGHPTMAAPAGYLFPSRRPWSLVYRIGTQDEQGEVGPVVFIANQTAPLEICVNDHPANLSDNRGSVFLRITVNERSAQ